MFSIASGAVYLDCEGRSGMRTAMGEACVFVDREHVFDQRAPGKYAEALAGVIE
ncbi:hypothetical protein NSND_61851 [Nitrospira sp. ND1]|nr:hypothetical protein NSND_61851 [Nitrospira sp. ND1]